MFTLGMTGLVASYVLVALLLLSINLYSRWPWPVKAATIIITSGFYLVAYYSIPPLLGWPTSSDLPEKFKLNAVHIIQPDKVTGEKGAIHLWLTELDDLDPAKVPRAYRLPYSDPLYEAVNNAKTKMKKGTEQMGETVSVDTDTLKLEREGRATQVSSPIRFYDLPDPLFPEK